MKTFNLFNEIIVTERAAFLSAINSNKEFAITYSGDIIYEAFEAHPIIYRGKIAPLSTSALAPQKPRSLNELLGSNYKLVEDNERVLIKAAGAWQEIINLNVRHCDYDDTTADGIAEFSDSKLEDMGWQATEFDVLYRDIVDVIEAKCDGIILCIEQDEPYQFSGMGFIFDKDCAHQSVHTFCKEIITQKIENDADFAKENLTDDEEEAAVFFGIL